MYLDIISLTVEIINCLKRPTTTLRFKMSVTNHLDKYIPTSFTQTVFPTTPVTQLVPCCYAHKNDRHTKCLCDL